MRHVALNARMTRAEALVGMSGPSVPHVLEMRPGVSRADALAAFAAAWPNQQRNHCLLVVPAKAEGPEAEARFERDFKAQQTALVKAARSARLDIAANAPCEAKPLLAPRVRSAAEPASTPPRMLGSIGAFAASKKLSASQFARLSGVVTND